MNDWRMENPGEKVSRAVWNRVFTTAFHKVQNSPDTKRGIIQSFKKCNLFPLVDVLSDSNINIESNITGSSSKLSSSVLSNTRLSEPFLVDELDRERAKKSRCDVESTREIEVVVPNINQPDISIIQYKIAQPGTEEYALLINSASAEFFQKSFLVPAQEQSIFNQIIKT